jgi:hypothetical protein
MKITKSRLKQIIKEELKNVLNESADKEQKWNEFARKYSGMWIEKDGMKAIYIPGIDGQPKLSPRPINDVGLPNKATMNEGDITIVTDIPVSAGASSFDTDGDGDVDKLDPEAVRRALQADLPRLKSAMGSQDSQWTAKRTMDEFGDAPVMVDDDEFKEALQARLDVVESTLEREEGRSLSEEDAEAVYEEMYEIFQQRSSNY